MANVNNYINAARAVAQDSAQIFGTIRDSSPGYDEIAKANISETAKTKATYAINEAAAARARINAETDINLAKRKAKTAKDIRGINKQARMTGMLAGGAALLGIGAMQLNKKEEADPTLGILSQQIAKVNNRIDDTKSEIDRLTALGDSLNPDNIDYGDDSSSDTSSTKSTTTATTTSSTTKSGNKDTSSSGTPTFESIQQMAADAGAKYPKLVAAQWALESDWGNKPSGKNNYFGIKAAPGESSTTKPTWEVINGKEVDTTAPFKNFDSPRGSVTELVNKWYKDWGNYKGVNRAGSAEEAARLLLQENYATDPSYASKLIDIMNR